MSKTIPVLIAGAGIAGLAAALATARKGFDVCLFERAPHLMEVGAGLQISPNSSHILDRLGVLDRLGGSAIRPEAIHVADAISGRTLVTLPLGQWAEKRWRAPYLVAHRADLQSALLGAVKAEPAISLRMATEVTGAERRNGGVTAAIVSNGRHSQEAGRVLIAADGVWSGLRLQVRGMTPGGFSGFIAWRATLPASAPMAQRFDRRCVTVLVHRRFHLVAYPLRGGALINLVIVVRGEPIAATWENDTETGPLVRALGGTSVDGLASATRWSAWPIHEVEYRKAWVSDAGIALIGDAAHAMTPFAAQGAAMAIEDAETLAACLSSAGAEPGETLSALRRYETLRKSRVARVAQRGVLNRLAWHAAGPAAIARNLLISRRGGERLMQDLDWLYGWQVGE